MANKFLIGIAFVGGLSTMVTFSAFGAVKTQLVEYSSGGDKMEGFVAYDDSKGDPKPVVLIVHDWMGLGDYSKGKAVQLANLGYVGFAADIYGKGIRPKDSQEAAKLATKYKDSRSLLRAHIRAAFDKAVEMKNVDSKNVVGIGYCFGGTTVLELARSGAPVIGTVTFHGGLSNPKPEDAKNIKGHVLILHGADDPFVPPAEVESFKNEMNKSGKKFEFVAYKGAVHSFTNPAAGSDNSKGAAYNADADKKSWVAFLKFLSDYVKNP